jgi:lipoate-protein ligase A
VWVILNFDNKIEFKFGFTPNYDGFDNMEIDRYLGSENPPKKAIIRFFTWNRPTISYGYNQNPEQRFDLEKCQADNIEVVRRPTGGREILHGYDLCFSVIWPFSLMTDRMDGRKLFDFINQILRSGLSELGIESNWKTFSTKSRTISGPCFSQVDRGEISVGGKKLVASAQRTFEATFLQQSSIPLKFGELDIIDYMKHKDADKEKLRTLIRNSTTTLENHFIETKSVIEIVEQLRAGFEKSLNCEAEGIEEEIHSFINNESILNKVKETT